MAAVWASEEDTKAAEGRNVGEWGEVSPSEVGVRSEGDGGASSQKVEELHTCRLDVERKGERPPCRNCKNQENEIYHRNVNLLQQSQQKKVKSKAATNRTQE